MNDPVTDYVIYYQPKGGAVSSDKVSGGETESHLLDGLQRGVTYNIFIVALSDHLPSPLVGPVTPGEGYVKSSFRILFLYRFSDNDSITLSCNITVPTSRTTATTAPSSGTTATTGLSSETTATSPASETTRDSSSTTNSPSNDTIDPTNTSITHSTSNSETLSTSMS